MPVLKKKLSFSLFAIFISIMSGAIILYQPWVTPLSSSQQHADPQRLEKDVRYFSETLYPRSADRREHLDAAAKYITQVFEQNGAYNSQAGLLSTIKKPPISAVFLFFIALTSAAAPAARY